jgi:alkylated DNA repair protein alkB family protein 8
MKKETVEKILNETEVGYNLISNKFSQTRKHFWRELEFVKDFVKKGDKVLDFGCGNGRLLELLADKEFEYFGVDVSEKLIEIAKNKYQKENTAFQKISSVEKKIPFENEFFDAIYSIAVFHHIPSKNYREELVKELYKKTKIGGIIIVTVWNIWQKKYIKNIFNNWKSKLSGKSDLDWNDCEISFTDNEGVKIQRFHHAFTKNEFEKLFNQVGFKTEKCEVVNGRNILFIGKK